MTAIPFAARGVRGEATERLAGEDLPALARRLLDPGVALATLHWGRNYIYRATLTADPGSPAVAVKQFRDSRGGGHAARKAAKSFRMAREFAAAGLPTPEPFFFAEVVAETAPEGSVQRAGGTAVFVCRALGDRIELRYLLRARNAGLEHEQFPALDCGALIDGVAALARRMHDAGFWHRDFSIGNLLVAPAAAGGSPPEISVVDLNRCRRLAVVPLVARLRDLCRLPLDRAEDRARLLAGYFGGAEKVAAPDRLRYELARRAFLGRNRLKAGARGAALRAKAWLVPRGTHAHIPPPQEGASPRDKIVWDALSDQPHSHASRLERARVRFTDAPSHLRSLLALAGAVPRIRRRYRELGSELGRGAVVPFPWPEPGVAVRPWSADPAPLLAAFDELGARRALLRLHPWQDKHDAEERLARELAARGVEIAFTLPQSRELVKDRARWRAAVAELAERFAPLGSRFQIGQAVNRSKWGLWSHDDYLALAADAAEILRRPRPGVAPVELFGPAVIDFEAHVTAAIVNRRHPTLRLDGLASLLYVDRRGAPENRQLGCDTADKVRWLAAIAGTGRLVSSGRQWLSEVNWPLREGPHSPAGKSVSVDEESQADYLPRYYLLAAGEGRVERIDWWQLVARGYGLIDPGSDGQLRRRPSFRAFATLRRELAGAECRGPVELAPGLRALAFRRGGAELLAVWAPGGPVDWTPPRPLARLVERDGGERVPGPGPLRITGSLCYLAFSPPA